MNLPALHASPNAHPLRGLGIGPAAAVVLAVPHTLMVIVATALFFGLDAITPGGCSSALPC